MLRKTDGFWLGSINVESHLLKTVKLGNDQKLVKANAIICNTPQPSESHRLLAMGEGQSKLTLLYAT
jgi:hypothetical protein